jgi:uncharacterized damage-inducible protein DinB
MSRAIAAPRRRLLLSLALAIAVFGLPRAAESQELDAKSALVFRDAFVEDIDLVHRKLLALANAIPADKYDWRPTPEVRTVSNVLMHVAMEWYFILPACFGGKVTSEWPSFPEARTKLFAITAKTDVLDQLDRAWSFARAQIAAASGPQLLATRADRTLNALHVAPVDLPPYPFQRAVIWIAGDQHEHLGQLITYARSLGVVPPWSK